MQEAEKFFQRIMVQGDVLRFKDLLSRMDRASRPAREYLQSRCRDVRELEEFFMDRQHLFFVDNKRVALYSEELEEAPQLAESYFEQRLRAIRKPVVWTELKNLLDDAPDPVGTYIHSFYPSHEFKNFLRARPNVFLFRRDGTVCLIELESVAFFKKRFKVFGGHKIPFTNFRGHVGQAPPDIQAFMNKLYWGDDFQIFLQRNNDVFQLDANGDVSLVPFV